MCALAPSAVFCMSPMSCQSATTVPSGATPMVPKENVADRPSPRISVRSKSGGRLIVRASSKVRPLSVDRV